MPEQLIFQIQYLPVSSGSPQLAVYLLLGDGLSIPTQVYRFLEPDDEQKAQLEVRRTLEELTGTNIEPASPNFEIVRGLKELEKWLHRFFESDAPPFLVDILTNSSIEDIKNHLMEMHAIDGRNAGYI